MDKKSLDEFFAQAEDVLTNWPVKNVEDLDAANTEDPGRYELGDSEDDESCPWCGGQHDLITMVFISLLQSAVESELAVRSRPGTVVDPVNVVAIDLAETDLSPVVARRDSDGVIRLVNADPITIPTGESLFISAGTICLSSSDERDENIDNPD